jgi:predicted RNase H-like nuclease (RuvC/YqgF family)
MSLNICSKNHDEICFDGIYCPACEIIEDLEDKVEQLEIRNKKLDQENDELMSKIQDLEDQE